jgi:hypothetical protein
MQTHTKKQNIPQVPFAIIQLFSIVEEARSPTIRYFTGEYTGIVGGVGRRAWKVSGGRRLVLKWIMLVEYHAGTQRRDKMTILTYARGRVPSIPVIAALWMIV